MIPEGLAAVIFDFDGVIVESADIKTVAFRRLFEEECPTVADEAVAYHLRHEGVSRFDKFRHVYVDLLGCELPPGEETRLGDRFSQLVFDEIVRAPFVPGALEFLRSHANDLPMYVASGTPQEELGRIVESRGLADLFLGVCGTPRTKPQIISEILEDQGWQPHQVVFVGDADSDRLAAGETGLRFIARVADGSDKMLPCDVRIGNLTALDAALATAMRCPPVPLSARHEGAGAQ